MKHYLIHLDRLHSLIASFQDYETFLLYLNAAKQEWPAISGGLEVEIWDHIPTKQEFHNKHYNVRSTR